MIKYLFYPILLYSAVSLAQPSEYYDDKFNDKLVYLHALVNYDPHPLWYKYWEERMLSENGVLFSFGSVETQDLQTLFHLNINEPLNKNLRFLYRGRWFESQTTHNRMKSGYLGLEQRIFKSLSGYIMANPAFDKEEVDLRIGFRITDSLRVNYFSLGAVYEDFTYDTKNDLDGTSKFQPFGIHWLTRFTFNKFTFFSEGEYSTGFERTFEDIEKSPEFVYHKQKVNTGAAKLYYTLREQSLLLLGYTHYLFRDEMRFYEERDNYAFENFYHNIFAEYLRPVYKNVMVRIVARYLTQHSESRGFKSFDYSRDEIMPSFFIEYRSGRSVWELGYMESLFDWESRATPAEFSFAKDGAIEKVKLGWTYQFNQTSQIQVSLSHVFSFFGFGGANIQMVHFF